MSADIAASLARIARARAVVEAALHPYNRVLNDGLTVVRRVVAQPGTHWSDACETAVKLGWLKDPVTGALEPGEKAYELTAEGFYNVQRTGMTPAVTQAEKDAALFLFHWYQGAAMRTAVGPDALLPPIWYLALGLCGEAGEVAEAVKKSERHGFPLDKDKLKDELGDVLWYLAVLARAAGIDLDDIATANVEKLQERYPDGFVARGPGETAT